VDELDIGESGAAIVLSGFSEHTTSHGVPHVYNAKGITHYLANDLNLFTVSLFESIASMNAI